MQLHKNFSLADLCTKKFRHILMLLYWPLFGMVFWAMELLPGRIYHSVESSLDALVPFNEWFAIPYFFWFIYIIGSIVYFFFRDKTAYIKYMWYVIITYSITLIVYAIYPTSQPLRPQVTGEGILFDVIRWLYGYDTNTNVCPSLHVIGSFAVMFAALHSERIKSIIIKVIYIIAAVLICASTVFIKQHSVIDLFWGTVLSLAIYPFVFTNNCIGNRLVGIFEQKISKRNNAEVLTRN